MLCSVLPCRVRFPKRLPLKLQPALPLPNSFPHPAQPAYLTVEALYFQTLRLHHLDVLVFSSSSVPLISYKSYKFFFERFISILPNNNENNDHIINNWYMQGLSVLFLILSLGLQVALLFPFHSQGDGGSEHGQIAVTADSTS